MPTPAAPRGFFGSLLARATTEIRAAAKSLVGPPTQVEAPRPLSQHLLFLGVQTPEEVSALMRLADNGYQYRLCDFFEEQRNRDAHLNIVTFRREHAVATLPWQMIPASEKRRDLKIAAWVENALRAMGEVEHRDAARAGLSLVGLRDLVVHANSGVVPGYAASELLWSKVDGRIVPAGGLPMAPRRFIYSQIDGSLRWFDATGGPTGNTYPGKDLLRDFPAGRFLLHRPRINGAAGPREGYMRPLIWCSLFRTWDIGDWLKLAQLAAKPYRWGTYDKDAGDKDIDALDDALRYMVPEAWTRLRDTTQLHFEWPKFPPGEGIHQQLAAFLGGEMSKLMLGATLTVEEGNKGTARTANVHRDVARDICEIDARSVEGTIQRQLIGPLVRANFGNVPLPHFVFVTEETANLKELADAIDKLANRGLAIPAAWVRGLFGIPEPDVDEELLNGTLRKQPGEEPEAAKEPTEPADEEDSQEEPANDNEPEASDRALAVALRNYRLDAVLCMAGVRERRAA